MVIDYVTELCCLIKQPAIPSTSNLEGKNASSTSNLVNLPSTVSSNSNSNMIGVGNQSGSNSNNLGVALTPSVDQVGC